MSDTPTPPPQELKRHQESVEWLLRLSERARDGAAINDEELAAWIRWYEADATHAAAFEQMQDLWDALEQIPADSADALLRARLARFGSSRAALAWGGGTLAACLLATWAWFAWTPPPILRGLQPDSAIATQLGEKQEAVLPDGSTVALGAQSSLALEFAAHARHLKLNSGQAYFQVAKDKHRPFSVDTGELTIHAVGTAFDVRKSDGRVAVTVTEGVVDVLTTGEVRAAAPIRVSAGYQLIWDKGNADGRRKLLQLSHVDTTGTASWREGRLEYFNEPLSVVIADVNRYSQRPLVIEGADLGSLNFTGTILVDSISDWLAAIQISFPVSVRPGDNGELIIRRRAARTGLGTAPPSTPL